MVEYDESGELHELQKMVFARGFLQGSILGPLKYIVYTNVSMGRLYCMPMTLPSF